MGYKIISYKIFQTALRTVLNIIIELLILKMCHVFTILNPKIVFEETQMTCSLIMKSSAFMSSLFAFCEKNFNVYIAEG